MGSGTFRDSLEAAAIHSNPYIWQESRSLTTQSYKLINAHMQILLNLTKPANNYSGL